MRPFAYERAGDASPTRPGARRPGPDRRHVQFLAGGTTLIDLMKLDVLRPAAVVDINAAGRRSRRDRGRMPAACASAPWPRMADAADHPAVAPRLPGDRPVAGARRQPAAPQHGQPRRQCPAAHPLHLLPRPQLGRLQQARARLRLRGASTASTAATPCWASATSCIANYPGDFAVGAGRAGRRRSSWLGPGGTRAHRRSSDCTALPGDDAAPRDHPRRPAS